MIQPGLIVIGNRRYIKADLIPIKINTPSAAESIAILFAVYHIFNLIFPDNLNLVYIFLQNMMEYGKEKEALPNKKKRKHVNLWLSTIFHWKFYNFWSRNKTRKKKYNYFFSYFTSFGHFLFYDS